MNDVQRYIEANRERFLAELYDFLRMPSVSTQPVHRVDVRRAAVWLKDQMVAAGFPNVRIIDTEGHPIVYGEWMDAGLEAPTVLVYGHYDVQPPDPLDLWDSPPFEPTLRGDDLYARGASDDKGQSYIHVKVAEALNATAGTLPVNLKFVFEGEEETGSPHLDPFVETHSDMLSADVAVISDTHMLSKDQPSIVYALRGLAYLEITVTGPDHDLHSGTYGGAVQNPINALCRMIAKLQHPDGEIAIPGFYDYVRPLSEDERAELAKIPFDRAAWLKEAGVERDWGEEAYTIVERTTARPTLDVNGVWGGYTEPGGKTVLPSEAHAKLSMRLVPDQDPERISRITRDYLRTIVPEGIRAEIRDLHGGHGAIVPRDSQAMQAACRAYEAVFGAEPILVREGGSIPVVATFKRVLGIDTILMGFGLPDDRLHSPNEKFYLPHYFKGIETVACFLQDLGS